MKHALAFNGRFISASGAALASREDFGTDVYRELSRKYDIRRATVRELEEIAARLYHEREIDMYDYAVLTLSLDGHRQHAAMGASRTVGRDEHFDWLEVFGSRMKSSHRERNMSAYLHDKHLLVVLNRLK